MEGCLRFLPLFFLPLAALADGANGEWLSTTRALGMGNAAIAAAEDSTTAMFYNPAALSKTKKFTAELFNPQFDFGLNSHGSTTDLAKRTNLESMRPLLEKSPNKPTYTGGALFPHFTAQNFGFGILLRGEGGAYHDGSSLYYKSRYLVMPTLGMSISALSGRFRLGFAIRAIQLTDNDTSVAGFSSASTSSVGFLKDPNEGFGLGLDAGALFTLPWAGLPTLGFVARNVGDTNFSGAAPFSIGTGTITQKGLVKKTYDVGASISPKIGNKSVVVLSADYRDALGATGISKKRKINIGTEFNFSKFFFFRLGVSRGYWTAGIGLASKYGTLDISSYSEEMSAKQFRKVEDRRLSFRIGGRF